jgi:hypothetical protein
MVPLASWRSSAGERVGGTFGEVEEGREGGAVGEAGFLVAQFVEEGMGEDLHALEPLFRVVHEELRNEVDGVGWGAGPEDLRGDEQSWVLCAMDAV